METLLIFLNPMCKIVVSLAIFTNVKVYRTILLGILKQTSVRTPQNASDENVSFRNNAENFLHIYELVISKRQLDNCSFRKMKLTLITLRKIDYFTDFLFLQC